VTRLVTATGAFRAWFTVLVIVLCNLVAVGIAITYVVQRTREICGIVVLLDDRNQKLPPANDPDTIRFRTELHRYRERLGC